MRPEHICLCSVQTLFVRGGAEILVDTLSEELRKRDFAVDSITLPLFNSPRKDILKSALSWKMIDLDASLIQPVDLVIPTKFPSYAIQHPHKVTWLFHQLREAYDLFNTEYYYFHNHTQDREIREMIVTIDNATLPQSKAIYTISKNVSNRLKRYNGIDSTVLYPPPKRAELFKPGVAENYILSVGRLDPIKRIDMLVRAMAFTPDFISVKIVGEGRLRAMLEEIVEKLGLEKKVKFLGEVPEKELINLYRHCAGVFYAPFDEDYGFVTLEAFLSGKPVITCYDSGGPLEFVFHDETGLICNPIPHEIGEAITAICTDHQKSKVMGMNGKELIKDITWDRVIETLLSHD